MKRILTCIIALTLLLCSCGPKSIVSGSGEKLDFLSKYGIAIDPERPCYISDSIIPVDFDSYWDIMDVFAVNLYKKSLKEYRGKECTINMYAVSSVPSNIKREDGLETRINVIKCGSKIVCAYVDYISELKSYQPVSLEGKTLDELSKVSWDKWKLRMDDDDNKKLVIWQYYESLKTGQFDDAYSLIYDRENIKKDDFISAAKKHTLPDMDLQKIYQFQKSGDDRCSYAVKARIVNSKKVYEIIFDLRRNPEEKDFNGWKIYKTMIK